MLTTARAGIRKSFISHHTSGPVAAVHQEIDGLSQWKVWPSFLELYWSVEMIEITISDLFWMLLQVLSIFWQFRTEANLGHRDKCPTVANEVVFNLVTNRLDSCFQTSIVLLLLLVVLGVVLSVVGTCQDTLNDSEWPHPLNDPVKHSIGLLLLSYEWVPFTTIATRRPMSLHQSRVVASFSCRCAWNVGTSEWALG